MAIKKKNAPKINQELTLDDLIKNQIIELAMILGGLACDEIATSLKKSARVNFEIPDDEEILYVSENEDADEINIGAVFTDCAIYIIALQNEEYYRFRFPWLSLSSCKYQDGYVYINENAFPSDTFIPSSILALYENNYEDNDGFAIEATFNVIINKTKEERNSLEEESIQRYDNILTLRDKKDYTAAQQYLDQNFANWDARCYLAQGLIYSDQEKNEEALNWYDKAEEDHLINFPNKQKILAKLRIASYVKLEDLTNCRKYAFLADLDTRQKVEDTYIEYFYDLPYNERKFIIPIEKIEELSNDFVVLDIHHLPKNMLFPIGHPIAGQIYIGHPFLPQKYIPLDNYELELLEDKIREFCYVAGSLGATEVHVESVSLLNHRGKQTVAKSRGGNAAYKGIGLEGKYDTKSEQEFKEKLNQITSISQKFLPTKTPSLPKDLYWYPQEPSWQRLYKQRINGNIIEHNEHITTKNISFVQEREYLKINAGLNILLAKIEGEYSKETHKEYHAQKQLEIILNVKFAPIDSLPAVKK